jgi:hypothetical protein
VDVSAFVERAWQGHVEGLAAETFGLSRLQMRANLAAANVQKRVSAARMEGRAHEVSMDAARASIMAAGSQRRVTHELAADRHEKAARWQQHFGEPEIAKAHLDAAREHRQAAATLPLQTGPRGGRFVQKGGYKWYVGRGEKPMLLGPA